MNSNQCMYADRYFLRSETNQLTGGPSTLRQAQGRQAQGIRCIRIVLACHEQMSPCECVEWRRGGGDCCEHHPMLLPLRGQSLRLCHCRRRPSASANEPRCPVVLIPKAAHFKAATQCVFALRNSTAWRRGGDSNPRYQFTRYGGLANRCFRPLSHLSKTIDFIDLNALFGLRIKTAK